MSDQQRTPDAGPKTRRGTGVRGAGVWGRSSRARYWIGTAIYFAAFIAATFGARAAGIPSVVVQLVLPVIWIAFVAAPRFHDFGRSGWWGFSVMAFGFVVGFVKGFWTASVHPDAATLGTIQVIYGLTLGIVSLAFMIWLGAKTGDRGSNDFGPAPGSRIRADAAETFD